MILFTVAGRIQTKVVTFLLLLLITVIFVATTQNTELWRLFAIAVVIGILLETLWGFLVKYQPGWLTWVLGFVEFACIAATAAAVGLKTPLSAGATYFWVSWIIIQLFLIYILPVLKPSWNDMGGEIR